MELDLVCLVPASTVVFSSDLLIVFTRDRLDLSHAVTFDPAAKSLSLSDPKLCGLTDHINYRDDIESPSQVSQPSAGLHISSTA